MADWAAVSPSERDRPSALCHSHRMTRQERQERLEGGRFASSSSVEGLLHGSRYQPLSALQRTFMTMMTRLTIPCPTSLSCSER